MINSGDSELLFEAYKQVINELTKNRIQDAIDRTTDVFPYNKERISRVRQKLKTYNRDPESPRDIEVMYRRNPTKFHLLSVEERSDGAIAVRAVTEGGQKLYFSEVNKQDRSDIPSTLWVSEEPWARFLDDEEVIFITRGDALKFFNLIKSSGLPTDRWSPPVQKLNILPISVYNNLKRQGDI